MQKIKQKNVPRECRQSCPVGNSKYHKALSKNQPMKKKLVIIFIQSLLAMLGSLYYSNFGDPIVNISDGELFQAERGFDPCNLCWWARILMYPIVPLSLIGLISKDYKIIRYILALSIPGILLEIHHYSLQKFNISTSQVCTFDNPCTAMTVDYLGFITIPFLCLIAFSVITVTGILALRQK
jgi:hypothetical protein